MCAILKCILSYFFIVILCSVMFYFVCIIVFRVRIKVMNEHLYLYALDQHHVDVLTRVPV